MRRAISIVILGAIVVFFASLWIEHRSQVTLPKPTGPFEVGRAIFDWRDANHEVLAWMWYPAEAGSGVIDDYIPASLRRPPSRGLFALLTRDASKVHCHSHRDARVAVGEHPVLILRGGASAPVVNYSTLAEDLASHGYVVAGIDAPHRTSIVVFPDGRIIARSRENDAEAGADINHLLAAWLSDIAFTLDRLPNAFPGHLDMSRVGVFGHSFGGAQALQFCRDDARCKAGVDIDGAPLGDVVRTGVGKPFLILLSDHSGEADAPRVMADIERVHAREIVTLPRANHFTFSDDGALLKSWIFRALLRVNGRRQLALTAQYLHAFFDAQLRPRRVSANRRLTGAHHV